MIERPQIQENNGGFDFIQGVKSWWNNNFEQNLFGTGEEDAIIMSQNREDEIEEVHLLRNVT